MNIDDIGQITQFNADEQSHIIVNKEVCQSCTRHYCVNACPANCYSFDAATGRLSVAYENCLECGTCLVICARQALEWTYPRGGYGVRYRMS